VTMAARPCPAGISGARCPRDFRSGRGRWCGCRLDSASLMSLPQEPPRGHKSRGHLAPLIPAGHGLAALVTFLLAVVTAISPR